MQLVKVGLCAFGMSGRVFHAPFLKQHPGFHLSAIVERSKEDSKNLYPEVTIYKSVEEMLESADVDLVVVNTPIQTHFEYCKMALEKGKNVIVEKPFAVNTAEAQELCRIAEENKVFLSVFQNRRFDRDFLQFQNVLAEGVIGELKEVEIRFDRFRPFRNSKEHKENPQLAGSGALHDLGAHLIDQSIQLFGEPTEIFADVYTMKDEDTSNDYFDIHLYYPDKLKVNLKTSVYIKEDYYAYKAFGSKGSFLQERSDNQEAELIAGAEPLFTGSWQTELCAPDGILNYIQESGESIREELWSKESSYMYYFQEIYEHIVFQAELPSSGQDVVSTMRVIDAAIESAKQKKIITF